MWTRELNRVESIVSTRQGRTNLSVDHLTIYEKGEPVGYQRTGTEDRESDIGT